MKLSHIGCTAVITLAALYMPQARAQAPEQGNGLVCDTADQIRQVMTAYDNSRDWNASLVAVNAGKVVCAVAHVAYLKGDKVGELDTKDGHFNIVEILVVGAYTPMLRPVPPEKQVTIFKPKPAQETNL